MGSYCITIFGKQIKAVVVFPAAKAGSFDITEIKIKGIVPAVFAIFMKSV